MSVKQIKLSSLSEGLKKEVKKHMKGGRVNSKNLPSNVKKLIEFEVGKSNRRRRVRVTFEDGNTIETPINGTEESIRSHYIGQYFDMGSGETEKMVKAVDVEFLSEELSETIENSKIRELWKILMIKDSRDLPSSPHIKDVLHICQVNGLKGKLLYWFDHFNGTLHVVSEGDRVVIGVEDGDIAPFTTGKAYPLNY